jgi:hypothetical protein
MLASLLACAHSCPCDDHLWSSDFDFCDTPSGLAEALCGVRTLHIIACTGCGYISYKSILVWAPSFSFVEALHLDRVQFTSLQEFLSLPFSELVYVSLDNIHFIQASSLASDMLTRRLQPVGPPYDIATLKGLRTKAIKLGHRDTSHLQRLLTALPEIERLDTRVPPDVSPGDRSEAAESVWLQLKELHGHVYDVTSCERRRNAEWMFSNSSLASDHMRQVRLTIPTKLGKLELCGGTCAVDSVQGPDDASTSSPPPHISQRPSGGLRRSRGL